jgi:hypothetical protein
VFFAQVIPIPSNPGFYVLLALFVGAAIAVRIVMRQRLPLKLKRFEGRERLSIEKIHDNFYPGYEMHEFVELWEEIASAAEVPPGLIRPTDRFDTELGPVKGFKIASEMDDLQDAFVRRCKQQQLDFREVKIQTVDDYIKHFALLQHST